MVKAQGYIETVVYTSDSWLGKRSLMAVTDILNNIRVS